jgi:hypothetical protein
VETRNHFKNGALPKSQWKFSRVHIEDISTYDKLKVDITNDLLNVDITDINTSDKLKVYIDAVDGLDFSLCTVPVKIK